MNKDKFLGSLLGLAVGDSLGAPIEFMERDSYEPITQMRSGGPFNLQAGQWTDDTSLALCMALSLIEKKCFDGADIIKRFLQWFRQGYMSATGHCFDIGNTTKAALLRFETEGEIFAGRETDPPSNGSLMRLAPMALFHADLKEAMFYAGESSRLTHAPKDCVDACRALAFLIHRALNARTKDEVLSTAHLPKDLTPGVTEILEGSYKNKSREDISAKGGALTCLEAAMWAFDQTDNFNDGVLLAVNLGEDSDTTGAVYGQIAGAFYGAQSIREDFLQDLYQRSELEKIGDDLMKAKAQRESNPYFYLGENPSVDLIVVTPDNKVLMITRSKKSEACPGMLAFPGGFIDSTAPKGGYWKGGLEAPEKAALRELKEETNLSITDLKKLISLGTYSGNKRDPRDSELSWSKSHAFIYKIDQETYDQQKHNIKGLDDADDAHWFDLEELLEKKLAFDHNMILLDAIKALK